MGKFSKQQLAAQKVSKANAKKAELEREKFLSEGRKGSLEVLNSKIDSLMDELMSVQIELASLSKASGVKVPSVTPKSSGDMVSIVKESVLLEVKKSLVLDVKKAVELAVKKAIELEVKEAVSLAVKQSIELLAPKKDKTSSVPSTKSNKN